MGRSSQRNVELMAEAGETGQPPKPLRPKQCHKYLQRTLAVAFPAIVEGFLKEARNGGCAHMKLAVELLESAKPEPRRTKGSAQRFLEELGE
ncbi:MAG TPA: hypothetical protein VMD97_13095 [Candidatus Aquilonibacter sp.]|nr:hypothetical protein [Candidatus Aquilonibacter sp.]